MEHQLLHDELHSEGQVVGVMFEFFYNRDVILREGAGEDLVNLTLTLLAFQALLNNVRGKLELAEANEIPSD